jgi:tetratricopeptide (TPR) repeat protein
MAQDQGKKLQAAERFLKQGKVDDALAQLRQLAESVPTDLLTLNRIGDLLARQGRAGEAIGYYLQIAGQFLDAGYVPKAIAIHKKILRLDPSSAQSLIQLGELYMQQKLPAEARRYLLAAAEQYLHHKDFAGAREVYQQLVTVQPDNPPAPGAPRRSDGGRRRRRPRW